MQSPGAPSQARRAPPCAQAMSGTGWLPGLTGGKADIVFENREAFPIPISVFRR